MSCSPYRVPVARLAAAQAAIEEARKAKAAKKKQAAGHCAEPFPQSRSEFSEQLFLFGKFS